MNDGDSVLAKVTHTIKSSQKFVKRVPFIP